MQPFFEDDWIKPSIENDGRIISQKMLLWRLKDPVIIPTKIDISIMVDAVKRMSLGERPYVSLSGGVDSQAACLLLKEAAIKFNIAILEFDSGFNDMDVISAISFCDKHNFKYNVFKIDIINFLVRDLHNYVVNYECPSPQFSSHFKFFEDLISIKNPTSIICGGNTPFLQDGKWIFNTSRSQNAWTFFSNKNKQNMIGNFLCWSKDLAYPLMMSTDNVPNGEDLEIRRYLAKVDGMHKLGIDVTPQSKKFNGFEKIKEHFKQLTNDGWAFEKMFRHPNLKYVDEYIGILDLSKEQNDILIDSHFDNRKLFSARANRKLFPMMPSWKIVYS